MPALRQNYSIYFQSKKILHLICLLEGSSCTRQTPSSLSMDTSTSNGKTQGDGEKVGSDQKDPNEPKDFIICGKYINTGKQEKFKELPLKTIDPNGDLPPIKCKGSETNEKEEAIRNIQERMREHRSSPILPINDFLTKSWGWKSY